MDDVMSQQVHELNTQSPIVHGIPIECGDSVITPHLGMLLSAQIQF
jgi:hypothetical protein